MRSSSSSTHILDPLTAGSISGSSDEDLPECSSQSDLDSLTFDTSEGSTSSELQHTFARLQEVEVMRSSILSLPQRVELNRSILQHLFRSPVAMGESEINTGSDLNISDLQDQHNGTRDRPFVSAPLPRQQQCADGVRMKRRPEPLRADHNLLTPGTRSLSGVKFCPVLQVNSLPQQRHNNSSNIQTASRFTRRRSESSPNRRLRFEDETEKEAESRYLERQKRRTGQRVQDILVSKPDVSQYVNGRHKAELVENQHIDQPGLNLHLHPTPPSYIQGQSSYLMAPGRPHISLRTEPIKETYIGVVTYSDSDAGDNGPEVEQRRAVQRKSNHVNHNGCHKKATAQSDLPINPYAPEQVAINTHPRVSPIFTTSPSTSSPVTTQNGTPSDTKTNKKWNQKKSKAKDQKCQNLDQCVDHKQKGASGAETAQHEFQTQGELGGEESGVGEISLNAKLKTSSSSSSSAVGTAISVSNNNGDTKGKQPLKMEHHCVDSARLEPVEGSRLSLRRLFSSVRVGRSRTSSLDRASSRSCTAPDIAPSGLTKPYGLLKKTPSVQSLTMGSPFLKLRKSASVQNFVLEQKKKDRSDNYKPSAQSALQRCLSVEDVSCPSSLRSVGRIREVYSDGTLLLELSRPKSQTYGFIISRGKGRPDSGVYVDEMVDISTEKLYAGLLAVGDEILEVNEEKVACLTLDQVTHLLTQSSTVTVRVLRQRKPPSR